MKIASLCKSVALSVLLYACAMPAFAQSTTTLTFEGLRDGESVGQFYNGGTGGNFGNDDHQYDLIAKGKAATFAEFTGIAGYLNLLP